MCACMAPIGSLQVEQEALRTNCAHTHTLKRSTSAVHGKPVVVNTVGQAELNQAQSQPATPIPENPNRGEGHRQAGPSSLELSWRLLLSSGDGACPSHSRCPPQEPAKQTLDGSCQSYNKPYLTESCLLLKIELSVSFTNEKPVLTIS